MLNKGDLASRLDWGKLLGFSNISGQRFEKSGRNGEGLGAKVGSKEGLKPNVATQLGAKIGNKPGLKPVIDTRFKAKIGGKLGMKTGMKPTM